MPNDLVLRLAEDRVEDRRLGRNIRHDPRSLRYVVPEAATAPVITWQEQIGILDQGNLGSCTGNAATGMLGCEPFYSQLPAGHPTLDEAFAVQMYSQATQLDSDPDNYPPTDTGSDGLSVCKAAVNDGYAKGYVHATSLAGCYTMIAQGPFIIGVNWYSGMDNPDAQGNVSVSGQIRGGHEVCVVAREADGRWKVRNSWGTSWGVGGYFWLTDAQLTRLLAEQGDATQVAVTVAPAPSPQPQPTPTPTPTPPAPQPTDQAYVAWQRDVKPAYDAFKAHPIKGRRAFIAAQDAWEINVT